MDVEKQESGVCVGCPLDASNKAGREVSDNNPRLYEGTSKDIVDGAAELEEQILVAIVKRIKCQGPQINQQNQHVCSLAAVFNGATATVSGPNGMVKGSMRFENLVHDESEEKNGLYL